MSLHQNPGSLLAWLQGLWCSQCPWPALHPPQFSPLPPRPSCPQLPLECSYLVSQPSPAPRSPPPKARCHSQLSAWQQRTPREFQNSPGGTRAGGKLEPPEPGLCRPLPAGFAAQHTRSCCDYKRLLWAPSQERCSRHPHPSTLRGRGPGHRQPAGPAQHVSPPCPSGPRQTGGDFFLVGRAHTGGLVPQALPSPEVLCSNRTPAWTPVLWTRQADSIGLCASH